MPDAHARESFSRFVGRRAMLGRLESALATAAEGHGTVVALMGEPGIGKTRLVQEYARMAGRQGVPVAWSACVHDRQAPGFWPWTQVVKGVLSAVPAAESHLGAAARLTDVGAAPDSFADDPELARYVLFDGVLALLRHATADRPMLLVIDDVHWADASSLALLGFVARHVGTLPMVLAVTCRPDEPMTDESSELLGDVLTRAERIELTGLDETELGELVAALDTSIGGRTHIADLHRRTGGNPLFALELRRDASRDPAGSDQLPDTIQAVITRRIHLVSQRARDLLEVAAAVGASFRLDVLAAVLKIDTLDALERLEEARSHRFVRSTESDRCEFTHALLRDAIYVELGLARRVRLHERVADELVGLAEAGASVDPAEIAHHYLLATPAGRAVDAVRYLRRAGEQAMRMLAYEDAVRHHASALDVLAAHPDVADRADLLLAYGAAQLAAGDRDGARASHLEAAERARATGDADQLAVAALGLGGGRVGFEVTLFDRDQVRLLEEALAGLDEGSPLRPYVLARLSVATSLDESIDRRTELSHRSVALARDGDDRLALAVALAAHCDAIAGPADSEERLAAAAEIVALARELADVRMELLGRRLAVVALLEQGNLGDADAQITEFGRLAGTLRQSLFSWYVPMWRAMQELIAGRIDEAGRWLDKAEGEGKRAGSSNAVILCATQRWWQLIESGRFDEQVSYLKSCGYLPGWTPFAFQVSTALSEAAAGRYEPARHRLASVGVAAIAELPVDSEWLPFMAGIATVAERTGARDFAEWIYPRLLPYRERFVVDGIAAHCFGSVERFLGVLAAALDRPDDARTHFDAAIEANESAGMSLAVAATLRDAALALGERTWYERAIAAYGALSIAPLVADVTARLEAIGAPTRDEVQDEGRSVAGEFVCEGEYWRLTWSGRTVHVKDSKGMHDLAVLLANPGREVPALDLTGAPGGGDLGEVIDARARAAYQARLAELDEEIDDADRMGDAERSSRAIVEKDALVEQLTAAYGMGGRVRKAGDPGEKARSTVSWRIRHSIQRITEAHPDLGKHLKNAVRTGRFVTYDPEVATSWTLR